MKRIGVLGISTEVGKTVVSAILVQALSGHYWKPIQCGTPTDRSWIETLLSIENRTYSEKFCLSSPSSPHLAARQEGIQIELADIKLPDCPGHLIIEGAGGILSPLNEHHGWIEAALSWDVHWVLVHRHYLGSFNHFLLTTEYLRHKEIPLLGVVFNGQGDTATEEMLLKKAHTQCIGRLAWYNTVNLDVVQQVAQTWKPKLIQLLGL